MKYTKWSLRPASPGARREMESEGVHPLVAAALCARGFATAAQAREFLGSGEELLWDPFLLRDMDKAVSRLTGALERGETVAVYGDYDVDGITATALLTDYLRRRGGEVIPYIPDRMEEGYGLNREAVEVLWKQGVTLIVTVDCGITAVEEAELCHELGVDLIITDHHECKERLPGAMAVVDPCREDCDYPFSDLAGVGVALKLALALEGKEGRGALLREYGDLAAIGTIADVMKVVGENRTIIRLGLETLAHTRRPGLAALLEKAGMGGGAINSTSVGYSLAPRINASGRMGCAMLALELLLTGDAVRGEELSGQLCALNRERQEVEGRIFEECLAAVEALPPSARRVLALAKEGWHQGVVGIVASRLSERYSCPVFMVSLQNGRGKGSCRSFGQFDLFAALRECADLLEGFGGHAAAAGFTIREEMLPAFRERMDRVVADFTGGEGMVSTLEVDAQVEDPAILSEEGVLALERLEPYGIGNPRPVFLLSGCCVALCSDVGSGRHLKLRLQYRGVSLDAIFFSATMAQTGVSPGCRLDVAFTPQINEFRGRRSVQLLVTDLREAATRAQSERSLYERFRAGADLTPREAEQLIPSRAEFAAVWRYLNAKRAGGTVEETAAHLTRGVSRSYGVRETYMRTMVCLEVFEERGLIRSERRGEALRIELSAPAEKVDLEQSPTLRRLRRLRDT